MLMAAIGLPVSAARQYPEYIDNIGIYDEQDILSDDEEEALSSTIRETADRIDMYVAVVIVGPETYLSSDYDVMAYADDYYDKLFNSGPLDEEEDTDGILLLINNSTKYDWITTSGTGQIYFTNDPDNNKVDGIFDDIWDAMLDGDYAEVVRDFCRSIEYYHDEGYSSSDYTYLPGKGYGIIKDGMLVWQDAPPKNYMMWLLFILASAGIGIVVAIVVFFAVKSSYKFKSAVNPTSYVCGNNSQLHISTDTFLREHTSKVRMQSSSGGGGGRSGGGRSHRSSGGRSRGGGGRRR